ncbi:MAG: alpha/beta hydrolase [Alphaproteobacteria bacterium]|nr:alpha/beta hydrolase [Alphaproteobacteria bacterium]MBU1513430.1 alpha/beta hydrolase [Alphaproteobacteria bacterium]MBU2096422.1 alpha/beta hydrolase [Alphaproteobacteria bacterium]MBU2149886.1 alpha/beta hydrolase [Alphaproteobacteria bacterium]MBU2308208.1 alpha/beta hydrolase [Alphaproteobacteria bacterium]
MFRKLAALALALTMATAAHAAPQDKAAKNGDVKIHYVVDGKGPLVVMVHGFPDYWATWKPLMAELNKAGYRTAALDLRGYNLSDKPTGVAAYAMPNLIGDVAAVIAAEGQKNAIVIGHDWGAAISWQVAFNRPDLVNKLVIMSVPHPAGMARELATNPAQREGSNYARNFQKEGSEKALTAEGLAGWVKDPAAKPGYVEAFKRSDFAAMMNYYRANYPRGSGAETETPATMAAPNQRVKVPVLVIHGMKDTALNAAGHAGVWNYVDADTTILMAPNAGHFVQHDAEALVDTTVRDWLNARR